MVTTGEMKMKNSFTKQPGINFHLSDTERKSSSCLAPSPSLPGLDTSRDENTFGSQWP